MKNTPLALIIMDGYGLGENKPGNAIFSANTPELDTLFSSRPHTRLKASGLSVGLPDGQIGNSEVGHMNIGAGRVVFQELPRISNAIADGSFFQNIAYIRAMDKCVETGSSLHLLGLMSNGGVHSHISHLFALIKMARDRNVRRVYVHAFMDGRDVSPTSGSSLMAELTAHCRLYDASVATVMGRFYAMDRDKRYARIEKAYNAMVFGEGEKNPDPVDALQKSYTIGVTDEFIEPVICDGSGLIRPGDSVIFFNFRSDRAREITYALTREDFDGFTRKTGLLGLTYVCTCLYDEALANLLVAFPPEELRGTLGEYLSSMGYTQLRIAETEKYAHVTFFFNGGAESLFPGESRILIPSPREYPTYDLIPEMSAYAVTDAILKEIESVRPDILIINYANCDMVGHTGVLPAAIRAVETVDNCVGKVVRAIDSAGGICIITSDHGNADIMLDSAGNPVTSHTLNEVPFIVTGADVKLRPGKLADIAPTILELLGIVKPREMTGESLLCP